MKKTFCLVIGSIFLLLSGCYDREIIDKKDGDPLDPVTNLVYSLDGDNVDLSWTLPSQYPPDILLPVSVFISVYRNGMLINSQTVTGAPTTYTYNAYDPDYYYWIIVKVRADVDTDEKNKSNLRFSPGVTVYID